MASSAYLESRYRLGRLAKKAKQNIVELGVHRGRSLYYMADANFKTPITGVDAWGMPGLDDDDPGADAYAMGLTNYYIAARRLACFGNITLKQNKTVPAGEEWDQGPIDLWFHDADHTYDGVLNDWFAWRDHLTGWACFDDYDEFPGVRDAVHDLFTDEIVRIYADRLVMVWMPDLDSDETETPDHQN